MLAHPWIVNVMKQEVHISRWIRQVWGWPKPKRSKERSVTLIVFSSFPYCGFLVSATRHSLRAVHLKFQSMPPILSTAVNPGSDWGYLYQFLLRKRNCHLFLRVCKGFSFFESTFSFLLPHQCTPKFLSRILIANKRTTHSASYIFFLHTSNEYTLNTTSSFRILYSHHLVFLSFFFCSDF